MKPQSEIITGDCLKVMPELLERGLTFDACLADPPYGTTACAWDTPISFAPMWANLKRLVKQNGAIVLFGSQPFTSALVMSSPQMFRYQWVWNKKIAGNPFLASLQPLKIHEDVCVFSRERHVYNAETERGRMRTKGGGFSKLFSVVCASTESDEYQPKSIIEFSNAVRGDHPTQKPVELMRYLVRTYTNEGDTILDFTCGSGSTGVACVIENRNFIGIEISEEYCEIARARISRACGIPCDIPKRVVDRDLPLFNQPL